MGQPLAAGVNGDVPPPLGDRANFVASGKFTAPGPGQAVQFYGAFDVSIWASANTALTTTAGSLAASVASAAGLAAGAAINSINVPPGATAGVLSGTNVTLTLPPIGVEAQYVTGYPQMVVLGNAALAASLKGATITGPGWPAGTTVTGVGPTSAAGSLAQRTTLQTSASPTQGSEQQGAPFGTGTYPKVLFSPNGNAITATGADAAALFTGQSVQFTGSVQLERSFDGGVTWTVCNIGGAGTLAIWTAGTPVNFICGEPEQGVSYRLNCTALSAGNINWRLSTTGQAATVLAIPAGN